LRLGEAPRWGLGFVGVCLWLSASLLPTLSGPAEYAHRCRGRSDPAAFPDCFQDGLPVPEMMAPLAALLFAYPFARLAFSLYAPPPEARQLRWRLATRSSPTDLWPTLHLFGLIGMLWCLWRLLSYPFAAEFLPFQLAWGIFALWYLGGVLAALPGRGSR
jgi:hypothetical protein